MMTSPHGGPARDLRTQRLAAGAFFVLSLLAAAAPAAAAKRPDQVWTLDLSQTSPQALALAGAGAAWTDGDDPAPAARHDSSRLRLNAGEDASSRRLYGFQSWTQSPAGLTWGLGAGSLMQREMDVQSTLRGAVGVRLPLPRSPSLGAAFSFRRLAFDDLNQGLDLGLAWSLPWQDLDLAVGVRELRLYGREQNWSREGMLGLGWKTDGRRLALDLSQAADEGPVFHLGLEQRLDPDWTLITGFAGSPRVGQNPSWGLGLRCQWEHLWAEVGGRQPFGDGPSAVKAGVGWDFKVRREPRVPPPRLGVPEPPVAAPVPTPLPDPGTFEVQAGRDAGTVTLSWPAQPEAEGGYEVVMGLVLGATMRRAPGGWVISPSWRGSLALPGASYYFKVRVLGADGKMLAESKLLVLTPQGGKP